MTPSRSTSCKRVAVALIERAGKFLISRRKGGDSFAHHWELPGGGVQAEESPEACIVREVKEETGLTVQPEKYLGKFEYDYPMFTVEIHVYLCRPLGGEPRPLDSEEVAWIGWDEIRNYQFPAANEKIFSAARGLRRSSSADPT